MINKFFRYIGSLITILIIALITTALTARHLLDFINFLVPEISFGRLFAEQMTVSLTFLAAVTAELYFFRGKLVPKEYLKSSLPIITIAFLSEWGFSWYLLRDTEAEFEVHRVFAHIVSWLLALILSALTTKEGRRVLRGSAQIVIFLLSGAIILPIILLLWPFSPHGRLFYYVCRKVWAPFTSRLSGVKVETSGQELVNFNEPAILVATHSSILDIYALQFAVPRSLPMLSKKSIFYVPVFGQLAALAGCIFIDRSRHEKAMQKLDKSLQKLVKRKEWLAIFAEGTRSPEGYMRHLKKGAFVMAIKAGIPIVPIAIVGSGRALSAGSFIVNSGLISCLFGAPIATTGLTLADRDTLRQKTEEALLQLSGFKMLEEQKPAVAIAGEGGETQPVSQAISDIPDTSR